METIYGVQGTSRSRGYNSNQRGSGQRYSGSKQTYNTLKARGIPTVDALEYKRILDTVTDVKKDREIGSSNKFKSLIEHANEKLNSKIAIAPLKDESYDYETNNMMANGGMANKMRIEKTTDLRELNPRRPVNNSYASTDGQYKRDLGYDTEKTYNSYTSGKYNYMKAQEELYGSLIPEEPKKESFWSKLKNAVKGFFASKPKVAKKDESVSSSAIRTSEFRKSIPKAAPQIDKEEVEKRRIENIRAIAKESVR